MVDHFGPCPLGLTFDSNILARGCKRNKEYLWNGSWLLFCHTIWDLGKIPDNFRTHDEYLYKVLLVASKKLWTNPPSMDDGADSVNETHCMEKLTFSLRSDQYIKYWKSGPHTQITNPPPPLLSGGKKPRNTRGEHHVRQGFSTGFVPGTTILTRK